MKKYYDSNVQNLKEKQNIKLDINKLCKMALKSKNDMLKYKYINLFDLSLNIPLKYEIIRSIENIKIKKNLLNKYDKQLELEQISEIIMNIKNENEKNKLLKEYSLKLESQIFDIVGNDFILNDQIKYPTNYIEFIFIIFTYVVANKNSIDLKKVIFNSKLNEEKNSGISFNKTIEFCPLDYKNCDFYEYAEFINTVYHEVEHEIQNKLIREKITINNLNYRYLKIIKEKIVIMNHSNYDTGNINYQLESQEVDARMNSYIKTFKFINKYSNEKAKLYLHDLKSEIELNRKLTHILVRLKYDENIIINNYKEFFKEFNVLNGDNKVVINDMFDSIDITDNYLEEFPLLLLEYDRFGNKIETNEIVNRLLICYNILSNKKYKNCNLKLIENLKFFYSKLLNERNKIKKLKK